MPNPRLATRYAKSLIDLAVEKDQLEAVYKDMRYLKDLTGSSRDFAVFLSSPVLKADKKNSVFSAIAKDHLGPITLAFAQLLIAKGRESDLAAIASAFVEQYNVIRDIHRVKLVTATPVSEDVKKSIVDKVKAAAGIPQVELESSVNEDLIGGFVLEYNGKLMDASIARELQVIRKSIMDDTYISKVIA